MSCIEGEVLGFAGLVGAGQKRADELYLRSDEENLRFSGTGMGKRLEIRGVRDAMRADSRWYLRTGNRRPCIRIRACATI